MLVNLYLSDRSRKRNYASVLALSCNFPQEKACGLIASASHTTFCKQKRKQKSFKVEGEKDSRTAPRSYLEGDDITHNAGCS